MFLELQVALTLTRKILGGSGLPLDLGGVETIAAAPALDSSLLGGSPDLPVSSMRVALD
jgi:hypothetical protein